MITSKLFRMFLLFLGHLILLCNIALAQNHIFQIEEKAQIDLPIQIPADPRQSLLTVNITCTYTTNNYTDIDCQSNEFSSLSLELCDVGVNFTYVIINLSNEDVTLDYLLDESLSKISVGSSSLLQSKVAKTFKTEGVIDICQGEETIVKRVLALTSPLSSGAKLPYAEDSITIELPNLPIQLDFDDIKCIVNDGNSTLCDTYWQNATADCVVDLSFNYTFTNSGLACINIAAIKADVEELSSHVLEFDDLISYQDRRICAGESWTISDTRQQVNFCNIADHAWDVKLDINEFDGRTMGIISQYYWFPAPSAFPSMTSQPSSHPTVLPTDAPSVAPSIDTCVDCTLTGLISGSARIVLWGTGKTHLAFQGVCDVIAIDNPVLQLQIRTRPGRGNAWTGVVQAGVKWKATDEILFLFEGNDRLIIDQTSSYQNDVQYSVVENTAIPGKFVHTFQFTALPFDNFIRVEELPLGLHNIEVKGLGITFAKSVGLVGAWDQWDKDKRVQLRNGNLYGGYDAAFIAKSWRVLPAESFLNNPSDVCSTEVQCGPGEQVQCIEDLYAFDQLERSEFDVSCTSSCDEIKDPLLRLFCTEDSKSTGLSFWSCSNSVTEPIINDSIPPACAGSCAADALNSRFYIDAIGSSKTCQWAIEEPKRVDFRCGLPEVALNCCNSCCTECIGDAAGTNEFEVPEFGSTGTTGTCAWAAIDAATRCSYDSVLRMCCYTCTKAVPSDKPSTSPSDFFSSMPSYLPSTHPTLSPTSLPSFLPTTTPTLLFSSAPSVKPSVLPSNSPSFYPTDKPSHPPTQDPTKYPTDYPSQFPSTMPSILPSSSPSTTPSVKPSSIPSSIPSNIPSLVPSSAPSSAPTQESPSVTPSQNPSKGPTRAPVVDPPPTELPSPGPSSIPSSNPSWKPSFITLAPSEFPTPAPTISTNPTVGSTCAFPSTIGSVKFVHLNVCWIAEFSSGGDLAADFTQISDCSTSSFTKTAIFSTFNTTTNTFTEGSLGWSGSVVFRQDSNAVTTGAVTAILAPSSLWNVTALTFQLHLNVDTC